MTKKFILNADDFGMSEDFNRAVYEGYNFGILKSTSICTNGEAFEHAVNEIIPKCPDLSLGVHLNIIEGKSLGSGLNLLTDNFNEFNNGYLSLILKSLNKKFLEQTEKEFRLQIEKALNFGLKIDHIDSHVHTHAIPNLFDLTCKLAREYNIPQIRTQFEHFYITPQINLHNKNYFVNLIKIMLLNSFTLINRFKVKKYGLTTNEYLIGVGYTGMMNDKTVYYGLKSIKKDTVAEALIHPCKYENTEKKDSHTTEFELTVNGELKEKIKELGYEITNYIKN